MKEDPQYKGLVYKKSEGEYDKCCRSEQPEPETPKAPNVPDYYKSEFNNGIKIIGVKSLMNSLPLTASSLYAKNLFSFVRNLYSKEKKDFNINLDDQIIEKTLIKEI